MRNTADSRRFLTLLVLALLASSAALSGQPATTAIAIDIRPGSDVKMIERTASGALPIAILGSETVDVKRLDLTTIALAGAPAVAQRNGTLQGTLDDVNHDGFADLLVEIDVTRLQLSPADTTAVLRVLDFAGTMYQGADTVRVVSR